MGVDPANAATMQSAVANEPNDVSVRHYWRLMHLFVVCKKLLASTDVSDQQFSLNEVVTTDFVAVQ
jgi:hypothetical protein